MSFSCEFCNKLFSTKGNLINHQRRTKYCIKIQKTLNKNIIEQDMKNFVCEFCNKDFTQRQNLKNHQENCISQYKSIIRQKDEIISEKNRKLNNLKNLEQKILTLETELKIYKEQSNKIYNTVEEIAKQPRVSTMTNNKIMINTPIDLSYKTVNKVIQNNFSQEYLVQGQKGIAKFAYDNILKDEQGKLKYICTDAARQIFQFKDEDGSIQKDVRATKLTKALLDGEIKSASHKIACKKMACGGDEEFDSYTNNYYEIKDMEEDNSEFSKELSTLVT